MKKELAQMVRTKAYTEKYMYGVARIKSLVEAYDRQCVREHGCSPVQMIDFRIKSAESIADKLKKKGYEVSCENATRCLSDLAGVRVVCFSEKDICALEDYLCKREEISIVRRKDYIKMPKENGYQSLHLIVEMDYPAPELKMCTAGRKSAEEEKICVEIQIRTYAMHCWAEADHKLCYKSGCKNL